jgi:hypothetical protein
MTLTHSGPAWAMPKMRKGSSYTAREWKRASGATVRRITAMDKGITRVSYFDKSGKRIPALQSESVTGKATPAASREFVRTMRYYEAHGRLPSWRTRGNWFDQYAGYRTGANVRDQDAPVSRPRKNFPGAMARRSH